MAEEFSDLNIQFTDLGVIIINSDGTMSKIENWQDLSKPEQVKALRVISKRNERRKAELKQKQETEAGDQGIKEDEVIKEDQETLLLENKNT